jgi:uncharacterized protein Smg (DUF494 family)
MLEALKKELEEIDFSNPEVAEVLAEMDRVELEPDDEFVGLADDQTIRIRILSGLLIRRLNTSVRQHIRLHMDEEVRHSEAECHCFTQEMVALKARIDDLNKLMWVSLRLDHNLSTAEVIGLRQGRRVVKSKAQPSDIDGGMMIGMIGPLPADLASMLSILDGNKPRHHGGCSGSSH